MTGYVGNNCELEAERLVLDIDLELSLKPLDNKLVYMSVEDLSDDWDLAVLF